MAPKKKTTAKPVDKDQEDYTLRAYNGIRRMLFFNEIAPGQKIYYRDIAEQLHMSPTPVIQALKWLEFQGLVQHRPNRGFFLEPISINEINEIYDLREMLEVGLLTESFENATEEGIKNVKAALEQYVESYQQNYRKQQIVAAMDMHFALANLSNTPISVRFLRNLFDLIYLKYQVDIFFVRSSGQGVERHNAIVERILAGDKDGACQALREDIRNVRSKVVNGIKLHQEEKESLRFISNEDPNLRIDLTNGII